ncbi:nuclear transport factor 2 family protein [Candidatus Binatia bacterium]|jgi:limonene-1,2-epoxide hydrolase|nr:nuclear transport factor 2 family protein [Candidatus Binatia bacterium]
MQLDPSKTWRVVEERLARETDPRLRRNLETVLAHMKAEASGDLETLMRTVADDASYHAYGTPDAFMSPQGKPAVRAFYTAFVGSGAFRLELDVDRLVVDADCVVTEGTMRIAYPGAALQAMGHPVPEAECFYLYETRMIIAWPMDENGLVRGEDSYVGGDGFASIAERRIALADIRS